uniref:HECT domain-containing protein n=1 Tax=Knipowitschia caucasica TaxID=637954 RepID=A0AAV2KUW8_KNICA
MASSSTNKEKNVEEVAKNLISLIQKTLEPTNEPSSSNVAVNLPRPVPSVASEMQSPANVTPKADEDLRHSQAGLGLKVISLDEDASHQQISQELIMEFPKLQILKGSWMFYKATGGGGQRKLTVVSPQADGYTTPYLKRASNGGKITLYIAPIQGELDITPLEKNAAEFMSCEIKEMDKSDVECVDLDEKPNAKILTRKTTSKEVNSTPQPTSKKVLCPICDQLFDLDKVEFHASFCVESICGDDDNKAQGSDKIFESAPSTSENWKNAKDPKRAISLFNKELLKSNSSKPANSFTFDLRTGPEEQDRSYVSFYKSNGVEWASPLACTLAGDAAVGLGVNRHVMSTLMNKLRSGFHINVGHGPVTKIFDGQSDHLVPSNSAMMLEGELFLMAGRMLGHCFLYGGPGFPGLSPAIKHVLSGGSIETATVVVEDCPDLDLRDTIDLLKKTDLKEEERQNLVKLCLAWDLPLPTKDNIKCLHEKLLLHAVLGRASKQIKQIRKGLKETGIWPLLCERDDVVKLFFPSEVDAEITAEMILSPIQWPIPSTDSDSDDEDDCSVEEITRTCDYLKTYVNQASSEKRKSLLKFWVGWEVPQTRLTVKVQRGQFPRSMTCMDTIKLPSHYKTYQEFEKDLDAVIATFDTGFGLP